jgi:hypothetical protein
MKGYTYRKGDRVGNDRAGDGTVLHTFATSQQWGAPDDAAYVSWDHNPEMGAGSSVAFSWLNPAGGMVDVWTIRKHGLPGDYNTYRSLDHALESGLAVAKLGGIPSVIVRYEADRADGAPAAWVCMIPADGELGSYGIVPVLPDAAGALTCGECGQSWIQDITPAGRCPWEGDH